MRFFIRVTASFVVMLLGLAGAGGVQAMSKVVPFDVSLTGVAILTSQTSGDLHGSGSAIDIGAVTNDGQVQAHPEMPIGSCPFGFRSFNTETLTATDGATLSILSTDIACPQSPGQFQGTGHWVVTAGTGRLARASGSGTFSGFVDFAAQTFNIRFTGLVSYQSVPFTSSYSGSAGFSSASSTYFIGLGDASHLGTISTNGQASGLQPDSSCPDGIFNINVQTLTAANGDTLTVTSSDVACPTGPGQYQGSGNWYVSDGTGRFATAVGSGAFDGNSDFVAGTFNIDLTGSISY